MRSIGKAAGRIVLGRHGETEWNREGRIMGQGDSFLTQRGHSTLHAMGDVLAGMGIDRIVSSCLGRAAFTAGFYAMKLRVPVSFTNSIMELSSGSWEGCLRSTVGHDAVSLRPGWEARPPHGESYADAETRVGFFLEEIDIWKDQAVLIIGHAGINRVILKEMLWLENALAIRVVFPHDCFYVVEKPDMIFSISADRNVRQGLLLGPD